MKESWGVEPIGTGGYVSVRQHAPFGLDFKRKRWPYLLAKGREMAMCPVRGPLARCVGSAEVAPGRPERQVKAMLTV